MLREPLNKSRRARWRLCGRLRLGMRERGLIVPNKRAQTCRRPCKGPSHPGLAGEAVSRTRRDSAVATATVTRRGAHDLRLLRLKRAPHRLVQRFLRQALNHSPRSTPRSQNRPIVWCEPDDGHRRSGRGAPRGRCGCSVAGHDGCRMAPALAGDGMRFGALVSNNRTPLAGTTMPLPARIPSSPWRAIPGFHRFPGQPARWPGPTAVGLGRSAARAA